MNHLLRPVLAALSGSLHPSRRTIHLPIQIATHTDQSIAPMKTTLLPQQITELSGPPPDRWGAPRRFRAVLALLACAWLLAATNFSYAAPPVVGGPAPGNKPRAVQRAGSKLVDISYTVSDPDSATVAISVLISSDSGGTWTVPAVTFLPSSDIGPTVSVNSGGTPTPKVIVWNAEADWNFRGPITTMQVRVIATNGGQAIIPPATYARGNVTGDSDITDAPVFSVNVSPFYMDSTPVTGAQWNLVLTHANAHGWQFDNVGLSKAPTHPVHTINWFDAVKWCNARSELEGVTPVYYTDGPPNWANVYKTAHADGTAQAPLFVKPGANGYRLPTEGEWEQAARGGTSGQRFPWGNTINGSIANYYEQAGGRLYNAWGTPNPQVIPFSETDRRGYDKGGKYVRSATNYDPPVSYYDPQYNVTYATGSQPYTNPVTALAPNGYNLYDMAGNVQEWCWDWYGQNYYTDPASLANPQGPATGTLRVLRGGSWGGSAIYARCANRHKDSPLNAYTTVGFRCVRGL